MQTDAAVTRRLRTLQNLHRLIFRVGQVGDRRDRLLVARGRVERDIAAAEPHFHFEHFLGLDP